MDPTAATMVNYFTYPAYSKQSASLLITQIDFAEYHSEIYRYMLDLEIKNLPSIDHIEQQPELQWYMRAHLVEFLIEIHYQYSLKPETLYLAMNVVDRYVSKRVVYKKHYQLVGCASLWIASKFEDAKDKVPTLQDLYKMCCGAYDEQAFVQMEGHILATISWDIASSTPEAFLKYYLELEHMSSHKVMLYMARFLMEVTLFYKEFIPFRPSEISQACLLLSHAITHNTAVHTPVATNDNNTHRVLDMLHNYLSLRLEAVSPVVMKKYSLPSYHKVSSTVREYYLKRSAEPAASASPSNPSHSHRLLSPTKSFSAASACSSPSSVSSSASSYSNYTTDTDLSDYYPEEEPKTPSDCSYHTNTRAKILVPQNNQLSFNKSVTTTPSHPPVSQFTHYRNKENVPR